MSDSKLGSENQEEIAVNLRLYSPITIGVYCAVVTLPVGCFLYGVNLKRRGQVVIGTVMIVLSTLLFIGMMIATILDIGVFHARIWILFLIVGISLAKMESAPFRKALSQGAKKEKWWPPLIVVLISVIMSLLLSTLNESYDEAL